MMKYRFTNLGPIKSAEMELGGLTIIAGANNTGKTYIAYALYGLLEYLANFFIWDGQESIDDFWRRLNKINRMTHRQALRHRHSHRRDAEPAFTLDMRTASSDKTITATMRRNDVRRFIAEQMQFLCKDYSGDIGDIFAIPRNEFERAKVEVDLSHIKRTGPYKDKTDFFALEISESNVSITANKDLFPHSSRAMVFEQAVKGLILGYFIGGNFSSPFILPAERFGVSLFYKELDFTKNRVVEILQRMKDENTPDERSAFLLSSATARYAKPLKDNIDFTRSLDSTRKETGGLADGKFFDDIKDMMGGYYRWENNDVFFISKQRGGNSFKIPLHLASSSARGLSGFYFYLRHVASKGELLIVDEPETHLDTKNQILMTRLLARCVNAGMRVLITTHSDYIIKEFNNLIMLSAEFPEKEIFLARHKKQYTENDFLRKDDVRAYICENGGLTRCDVDNRGMIMPLFDDTIDRINKISNLLDNYLPDDA